MSGRSRIVLLVIALALTASLTFAGHETKKAAKPQGPDDLYSQVELFSNAVSAIRSDYVTEVDPKKIIYGSLRGMLYSLDDFSSFLDPDEYKEISVEARGEFGGIGVEITQKDGILTIITPIAGTPAEAAGVKAGDRIVRINGKTTKDMTLNDSIKLMRGEPGTQIVLTVWREKDEKVLDIPIKRAIINIASIKDAYLMDGKTGYVRLIEFQEKAGRELEDALRRLELQGMDSLILDIRNNPGGLLDAAIDVSEKFLPKDKVIVSTKGRNQSQDTVYKSLGRFQHPPYPVVVLVNEGSASASEIVAGALKDNKRAILLGTKTFGKASVQTVMPLKDGSALKLTTALYYTPSGKSIMNQGVAPDVVSELEEPKQQKDADDIFDKADESQMKKQVKTEKPKDVLERDSQLREAFNLIKALKVVKSKE
jgi:carboxyl-terminal processing protease